MFLKNNIQALLFHLKRKSYLLQAFLLTLSKISQSFSRKKKINKMNIIFIYFLSLTLCIDALILICNFSIFYRSFGEQNYSHNIMMKQNDRICHKIILRTPKQLQTYLLRQQYHIEGTPKIILGKQLPACLQQIWTDDIQGHPLPKLRQLNSNERAFTYARRLVITCSKLCKRYGYFIINENMVFSNKKGQILVWINPDPLENKVKIYLPTTIEGELAMIRSILTFLKLWLRIDYAYLFISKNIDDLLVRFQAVRIKTQDRAKYFLPKQDIKSRLSFNFDVRSLNQNHSYQLKGNHLLDQSRSIKQMVLNKNPSGLKTPSKLIQNFPNKDKYRSSHNNSQIEQNIQQNNPVFFGTNKQEKSPKNSQCQQCDFQHKTFNNYPSNTSTNYSVNQSLGLKSTGAYFPNRTTSNRKKYHPIVELINSQDPSPDQYQQNNLVFQEGKEDRAKRLKNSLDGIGQQVNELFLSNIQSQGKKEENIKKITAQFQDLLM